MFILLLAVGMTDGLFNGQRYFQCAPKHAVFARVETFHLLAPGSDAGSPSSSADAMDIDPQDTALPRRSPRRKVADTVQSSSGSTGAEEAHRAAVQIQKVMRGKKAREEARVERLWNAWQKLDTKEESELVQTHDVYEKLKSMYAKKKVRGRREPYNSFFV